MKLHNHICFVCDKKFITNYFYKRHMKHHETETFFRKILIDNFNEMFGHIPGDKKDDHP